MSIFYKMHIQSLRGTVKSDLKKLDFFTLETSKNHIIHNFFCAMGAKMTEIFKKLGLKNINDLFKTIKIQISKL